jgi:glutamyl endopeptidase
MGKKHNDEKDIGMETVSSLDKKTKQFKSIKKNKSNNDLMPVKIDFEHQFIEQTNPIDQKWEKGFFKEYGDLLVANDYPSKCICLLIIIGADNIRYYGTGFMISPRVIITAGHNVFFAGKWAKQIRAVPGADGTNSPYGSEITTELISTNNWTVFKKRDHDYGALILPSDDLFNRVKSYFQFREILEEGPIIIGGYPLSKGFKQITLHGVSQDISAFGITYNLPTEGGNSGSPVFILYGNQIFAIAVHTTGGNPSSGVRINPPVIKVWDDWINRQIIVT